MSGGRGRREQGEASLMASCFGSPPPPKAHTPHAHKMCYSRVHEAVLLGHAARGEGKGEGGGEEVSVGAH